METLSKRLAAFSKEDASESCAYQKRVDAVTEIDEDMGKFLAEVVFDTSIPATRLHRELKKSGIRTSPMAIAVHRKGECTCPKRGSN